MGDYCLRQHKPFSQPRTFVDGWAMTTVKDAAIDPMEGIILRVRLCSKHLTGKMEIAR